MSESRTRAATAWCLFDFANSSYTTLIVTVVFAVYFREVVVDASDNSGDRLWGLANFSAMLVVVLTSPVLGAIADDSGRRKLFLIGTSLTTVLATALLFFVGPGDLVAAMTLYILATIGFEGGYVFYNAFLIDVSTPATIGRISGRGWALGYLGGLAALLLCAPWIGSELRDAQGTLSETAILDRRFSFVIVAAFYLVFALPAFVWLEDRGRNVSKRSIGGSVRQALRQIRSTLAHVRRYREVVKFVLASMFFNDGITTVIVFSAVYATTTFGFGSRELYWLFLVMNLVGLPTTLLAGQLADRIGAKRTLVLTLLLWVGVVLLAFTAQGKPMFWAMAVAAAGGMGSIQAVGRSFMSQISPPEQQAEFFGFYVTSGKLAAVSGPLIFGYVSEWSGSQRLAVLSLLPLFLIGLALMLSIDDGVARRAARPPADS